jgi:hypothetical protein
MQDEKICSFLTVEMVEVMEWVTSWSDEEKIVDAIVIRTPDRPVRTLITTPHRR